MKAKGSREGMGRERRKSGRDTVKNEFSGIGTQLDSLAQAVT